VLNLLAAANVTADNSVRSWDSIPGVAFVGIMIGVVLLAAAIRMMFGKRRK
jgi:hypothetical protein